MTEFVKPTVQYVGKPEFAGHRAILHTLNHPNHLAGHSVSNTGYVVTSPVVDYDAETGRIETKNTIYVPKGD